MKFIAIEKRRHCIMIMLDNIQTISSPSEKFGTGLRCIRIAEKPTLIIE